MKTTKMLTLGMAMACSLCSSALFASNNAWTVACENVASSGTLTPNPLQYAGSQRGIAACVTIDANATTTAYSIFNYGPSWNQVELSITSDGKYKLAVNPGKTDFYEVVSDTEVTSGRHVFSALIRRGVNGGGHVISVIVKLDGENLFQVGDGTKSFVAGQFNNISFGTSDSANTISGAYWSSIESAGSNDTDADKIANIVADATEMFSLGSTYSATVTGNADWSALSWNPSFPSGGGLSADATLDVNAEATVTLNANTTLRKLTLTGNNNLTIDASSNSLTCNNFNLANFGGTLTIKGNSSIPATIPTGKTVVLDSVTASSAISVEGTLKTQGTCNLSGANQVTANGTLQVLSDSTSWNSASQGMKGTLTIEKDATFVNVLTSDAITYSAASTINVKGTLSMNGTRWTVPQACKLNFYPGCSVTGNGQGTSGALDFYRGNSNVKVEGEGTDPVTLSCGMRFREQGEVTFTNNSGATVKISGNLYENRKLTLTGTGKFELSSQNIACPITVAAATTLIPVGNLPGTITVSDGTTIAPTAQAGFTTLTLSGNAKVDATAFNEAGVILTFGNSIDTEKLAVEHVKEGLTAVVSANQVELTAGSNDWPENTNDCAGQAASAKFPGVPEALNNADAKKLADWAKANSVVFADKGSINPDAFLLNCADNETAIANAKQNFKITSISIDANGITVEPANGSDFGNGKVVLKGADNLNDVNWDTDITGKHFIKATLEVRAYNENGNNN